MFHRRRAAYALSSIACALVACNALVGIDPATLRAADAGDDATADAAADVSNDAPLDAPIDADAGLGDGCPDGRGPPMVRLDAFCIDSTEVTNEEYALFVTANGGATSGQP